MIAADYIALAPYITVGATLMLMMLAIAFWRTHLVALCGGLIVLAASLAAVFLSLSVQPRSVTPLMVIDGYTSFFNTLFIGAAICTLLIGYRYLIGRRGELEEFYLLVVIATLGAMVMASAQHFATLLLGLEILSVALYALIAYPEEGHPPLEAAVKYLVLSGVASTTMLFGVALIYHATGSLLFAYTASAQLLDPSLQIYVTVGQVMLFAGLAFKLSLVPFHMWTPDVYQGAPAPVTGFIATVSKGAVFAVLLRFTLMSDALASSQLYACIALFAGLSMIIGNVLALMQDNLKRLLAYSSIAHMGYLFIGLLAVAVLPDPTIAVETCLMYLVGYFLMTLTAFGVITLMSSAVEEADAQSIPMYAGLFWRRPLLAALLTIALLSLAGLPLTLGFIAKFYLFATAVEGTLWVLLWTLILGSAISVYYYVRVIFTMTQRDYEISYRHPSNSIVGLSSVTVLGLALLGLGIFPQPLIDVLRLLINSLS